MAKILIIEDNKIARLLIEEYLTNAGYLDLIFSETGEDGVAKAVSDMPALILTDTMLPGIDGFETCRKIKETLGDKVKVIVMTGSVDAVDAVKARRMGADDYVVKSSDHTLILKAIKRLI